MSAPTVEQHLSPAGVAQLLGLHVETVRQYARENEFPRAVSIGGKLRIPLGDVTEWLRRNRLRVDDELADPAARRARLKALREAA